MKKLTCFLGLLLILFSSCFAMAPGSSNYAGIEKNLFKEGDPVYVKHIGTLVCGSDALYGDIITVYIVGDRDWEDGDAMLNVVYSQNVTVSNSGKLLTPVYWNTTGIGAFDIIIDVNQNGRFDDGGGCPDVIDGSSDEGFSVSASNSSSTISPAANNSMANTSTSTPNNSVTGVTPLQNSSVTQADTKEFDIVPLIIILIGILIAVVIVVITWMTLR